MKENLNVTETMEEVMETPVTVDVCENDPLMMNPNATTEVLHMVGATYQEAKEVDKLVMVHDKYYETNNDTLTAKYSHRLDGFKPVSTDFEVIGFVGNTGTGAGDGFEVIIELYNAFLGKYVRVQIPRNISAKKLEQVFYNNGAFVSDAKELRKALRIKDTAAMKLLQAKTYYNITKPEKLPDRVKDAIDGVGLPEVKYTHNCIGWKETDDGELSFLASKSINTEGVDSEYRGDFQIQPKGSWELYLEMVAKYVCNNVHLLMMMAIGVSATVLGYVNRMFGLNILNPVVHLFGNSTTGKTTAAQLVASLGGLPETGRNASTFLTFNGTMNALIKKLNRNSGYPICVDEFSMNTTRDISPMLYALADGIEKERLSRDGSQLQVRSEFETVIVTNGEGSILSCANGNEGLRTRIIELAMIQWTEDATSADAIKSVVSQNYGFVTPLVAKYLLGLNNKASRKLEKKFNRWYKCFVAKAHKEHTSINITDRVSKILALFMISLEILLEVLKANNRNVLISFDGAILTKGFIFFYEQVLVPLAEEASIGLRAYKCLSDYFVANKKKFWHDGMDMNGTYEGTVLDNKTTVTINGNTYDRSVCFPVSKAEELLVKSGKFSDIKVCMREIQKLGLLMTHDSKRLEAKFPLVDEQCKGYRILLEQSDWLNLLWNA
ncbi:MAG: DUF927 domain-containing protein [Lachnospiraceae bacterium]|nr:DUF927 domain-containing protein [Lachnospiraceae bacterium]MBP3593977.1 DUF927 domain-containing protein [Lachnospiraceae bacterium]